jgi:carbon-monoxide dehydrogenase medium subunit
VYLPEFSLDRPRSLDEALALRSVHEDAAWYAGGTELLALMKLGLAAPSRLIDVKQLPELRLLGPRDGDLTIGAAVTHRTIERDPTVRRILPSLHQVAHVLANVRVRNVGSLGGNLCFAEPHSDPATLLLALGARIGVRSTARAREVPIEEFVVGPFETTLAAGELMTHVTVPRPDDVVDVALERRAFRERPTVNVVVARTRHGFRVAVGAAGPVPVRATEAERLLDERWASADDREDAAQAAGVAAAEVAGAYDEAGASAMYKEHLTTVLVRRAIGQLRASAA